MVRRDEFPGVVEPQGQFLVGNPVEANQDEVLADLLFSLEIDIGRNVHQQDFLVVGAGQRQRRR